MFLRGLVGFSVLLIHTLSSDLLLEASRLVKAVEASGGGKWHVNPFVSRRKIIQHIPTHFCLATESKDWNARVPAQRKVCHNSSGSTKDFGVEDQYPTVMSDLCNAAHYTSVEKLPGIWGTFFQLTVLTEVSSAPFEEPSECCVQQDQGTLQTQQHTSACLTHTLWLKNNQWWVTEGFACSHWSRHSFSSVPVLFEGSTTNLGHPPPSRLLDTSHQGVFSDQTTKASSLQQNPQQPAGAVRAHHNPASVCRHPHGVLSTPCHQAEPPCTDQGGRQQDHPSPAQGVKGHNKFISKCFPSWIPFPHPDQGHFLHLSHAQHSSHVQTHY